MLNALDKLFALQNAILLESRLIKALFIYSMVSFVIYMFTRTKQTYPVRTWLYIGLCATFMIEVAIMCLTANNIEQKTWMVNLVWSLYGLIASIQVLHAIYTYRNMCYIHDTSPHYVHDSKRYRTQNMDHGSWMVNLVWSLYGLVASIQLLHAIYTYRDYEFLNHKMLVTLMEKVEYMERNKALTWEMDDDDDVDWCSWVDVESLEDVDKLEDPDFVIQGDIGQAWFQLLRTQEDIIFAVASAEKLSLNSHVYMFWTFW